MIHLRLNMHASVEYRCASIHPIIGSMEKRAPIIRNRTIVDECDVLFAFWDGISTGTAYTVKYAHQKGKPIKLFRLKGEI